MKKFYQNSSAAIQKMLLILLPLLGVLIAYAYMKNDRGDWTTAGAICFVIFLILLYRVDLLKVFSNEAAKYIEITDSGVKFFDTSENYEALVRFSDINRVEIFRTKNSIRRLNLYLRNDQKVTLSRYAGLVELTEKLQSLKGINVIET